MAEKIVLATHNAGKIREFKSILEPLGYEAVSVHDVIADITEPEETGTTFAENALLKATYYMKATGLPCLADDSALPPTPSAAGPVSTRRAMPARTATMKLITRSSSPTWPPFRRNSGRSTTSVPSSSSGRTAGR